MRIYAAIAAAILATAPAWAQQRPHPQSQTRPVDHGPFTPEANRAYQGGGVILEGPPGAPPPPAAALGTPPAPPPPR